MISAITKQYDHYLSLEFTAFTEKLIAVLGLCELMDFEEEDVQRLKEIEEDTNDEVRVPLYTLDRAVFRSENLQKTDKVETKRSHVFEKNKKKYNDHDTIRLTENRIRFYLCQAIREVHQILSRNMVPYKIERAMSKIDDPNLKDYKKILEGNK